MDKPYLTIKEAIEYTKKSESTIKKLIRDIRKGTINAPDETIIKVTDDNGIERNEILSAFLKQRYSIDDKPNPLGMVRDKEIEYLKKEIESLKLDKEYFQNELSKERERSKEIDFIKAVLTAKDKEIESIKAMIENNPQALPPTETPKKKGFFSKLFGSDDTPNNPK